MAICGADSIGPVNQVIGGQAIIDLATQLFGQAPDFWGRYFKTPAEAGGEQYGAAIETPALHAAGIRLLAIARQTDNVGGSAAQGTADAQGNSDAIEAAFGWNAISAVGSEALVFLDVESVSPASADYYTGWSTGLMARSKARSNDTVTLIPCIYAGPLDNTTWNAVAAAIANGARCDAVWAARWNHVAGGCFPLPAWDPPRLALPPAITCPVVAWQYDKACHADQNGNGGFDTSVGNPNLANLQSYFLDRLITP